LISAGNFSARNRAHSMPIIRDDEEAASRELGQAETSSIEALAEDSAKVQLAPAATQPVVAESTESEREPIRCRTHGGARCRVRIPDERLYLRLWKTPTLERLARATVAALRCRWKLHRATYHLDTLALSPIRDTPIEGFSHFVTSMTAPIASGWSGCRGDLHPLETAALSRRTPDAVIQRQFNSSGPIADALYPVFVAPEVSVSVTARRRFPLHAPRTRIRELQ
jgi:hypothetical protein